MSEHNALQCLFDQLNLNGMKAWSLATINEFDLEIKYIKGKENMMSYALNKRIHVNIIIAMSSYGKYLQDRIFQAGQEDVRYMEVVHRLQQSTGTCIGTCSSTGTCIYFGTQGVDYHFTTDGLVRFRGMIYVPASSQLKKVILRKFLVKAYLGHLGYQKTLTMVNKFYQWPNLKRYVAEFVARCLDF